MRKAAVVAAVVVGLCLSTACSKGSSITKAQYVATADQVCAASAKEVGGLLSEFIRKETTRDASSTERYVRFVLIKHLRATINTLTTIPAPAGDGTYLGSMYADYAHSLAIRYSDPLGDSADESEAAAENRFATYGMKKCSTMSADAAVSADTQLAKARDEAAADKAKSKDPQAKG